MTPPRHAPLAWSSQASIIESLTQTLRAIAGNGVWGRFLIAGDERNARTAMKQQVAAGAAWTAASNWVEQAVALAVYIAIARLIGAEAFGVASMALAFVMLAEVLLRDTLSEGLISKQEAAREDEDAVFWSLIALALIAVGAIMAAAPLVARIFAEPEVAPLMQSFAPVCLLIAISGVPTAKLRRNMAFRMLAARAIAGVVAGGVVGIAMAANGMGPWSLVGQRVTLVGVNAVLALSGARWLPRSLPARSTLGAVRGLGTRVLALRAMSVAIAQTPAVALGIAMGPKAVALFSFAARLVEIALFLIATPLKRVIQPAAAAVRRAGGDTKALFQDMTEIAAFAAFASFAGLAFVGEALVGLMMGEEWRLAGAVIAPLCVGGAIMALTEVQEGYLIGLDRTSAFLRAIFVEVLVGVLLIGLASVYGPTAVAGAVALRVALVLPMRVAATLGAEKIPVRNYLRTLTGPLLAAAGMAGVLTVWRHATHVRLPDATYFPATIVIGVVSFWFFAILMTPATFRRLKVYASGKPQREPGDGNSKSD